MARRPRVLLAMSLVAAGAACGATPVEAGDEPGQRGFCEWFFGGYELFLPGQVEDFHWRSRPRYPNPAPYAGYSWSGGYPDGKGGIVALPPPGYNPGRLSTTTPLMGMTPGSPPSPAPGGSGVVPPPPSGYGPVFGAPGANATAPGAPGLNTSFPGAPAVNATRPGGPGLNPALPGTPGVNTTLPGTPGAGATVPVAPGTNATVPLPSASGVPR